MKPEDIIKAHYKKIASLGGQAIAKRGPEYMRELQKLGVAARRRNAKKKLSTEA